MRILLAVDGSQSAMRAVEGLIMHFDWYRGTPQVDLVTVHLPVPQLHGLSKVVSRDAVQRYYDEEGRANLKRAVVRLKSAGIKFTPRVLVGQIAATINAHASASRCDLIVLGSRGRSAAANAILGSTAAKLLQIAKTPVMVMT